MKKLLALFSYVICLFFISTTYANPYFQPYSNSQYPYTDHQCVGRCEDPCVGQCAQSHRGSHFYAGAFGGANWLNFHRFHDTKPKSKVGVAGALSLGYKFNNGFRVEGEVAYRKNHLKASDWFSGSYEGTKLSGSTSSWSYMANFLYDFDCVSHHLHNVVPYVGVGLGYNQVHAHIKSHGDERISAKGKGHGIAGQTIAGVGYRLTNSTTLGVEYRYFVGREHVRDHSVGLAIRQAF